MKLIIGDKNLSSWSLRPWLALKAFGIAFEEIKIFLDRPTTTAEILQYSPTAKVPCLIDGDLVIPESLAIMEYLQDKFPDQKMWPRDLKTRAKARKDIDRIEQIWKDCLAQGGPYLFGDFSLADAMFAPVVNRFRAYDVSVSSTTRQYMTTILAHPAMQEWEQDALKEVGGQ